MVTRIPKLLLLVALLSALAVSSGPTFGESGRCKVCVFTLDATNCSIDKNSNCHADACVSGQPCSHSGCGAGFCIGPGSGGF